MGKTFLCFASACQYALEHPHVAVVVIDMCPQANISEILLGGNGSGGQTLQRFLESDRRPTIGGYFDGRIHQPHTKLGSETGFLTHVRAENQNAPENLFLVVGDPSLELQVKTVNLIASQDIPSDSWRTVHSWVCDLEDAAASRFRECAFFIDCNPSFSAYTEQAILAAERLVIPCTADSSSVRAIGNVNQLVYGRGSTNPYGEASFSVKARRFSMSVPYPYLLAMNRSTTYRRKSAKAFATMYGLVRTRVAELGFHSPLGEDGMFIEIPDAHTVAVVSSHLGIPIQNLRPVQYDLEGERVQIGQEPLERYQASIRELVRRF